MIFAGYIFTDDLPCPADVNGYGAVMTSWHTLERNLDWFRALQRKGVEIVQRYAASYFPGDPAKASLESVTYGALLNYVKSEDAWLRNPDGEIATDTFGSHFFDMRASRCHASEIARHGIIEFLMRLEAGYDFMPDSVFLDCVYDHGPYNEIWQATDNERANWARGNAMYLAATKAICRLKWKTKVYGNGETAHAHLLDGICFEGYPVNGDYMAIMHEHGPAWARDNGLVRLAVPYTSGHMAHPKPWAVASAVLAFAATERKRNDIAIVFDNGGAVLDVMGKLGRMG